jgi:hypothetical protein
MESAGEGSRANRTQEVAGSSPASSTGERAANAALSFSILETKKALGQVLVN